ncbi:MAG: hypothetical protein ACP5PS_02900, partial [Bacteroidales bacterium]
DSIRRACGDSMTYIRLFILPQLAQRWLYFHYYYDTNFHRSQRMMAQSYIGQLEKMASQKPLWEYASGICAEQLASKAGLKTLRYKVSETTGIEVWIPGKQTKKTLVENPSQQDGRGIPSETYRNFIQWAERNEQNLTQHLIQQVLCYLKPGMVFPYPVEWQTEFWIVQLIDKINDTYYCIVIKVPKNDFFQWFGSALLQK